MACKATVARGITLVLFLLVGACGGTVPATTTGQPRRAPSPQPQHAATRQPTSEPAARSAFDCLPDCAGASLQRADLRKAELAGANLGGAYLRLADLREADLGGADLHWAQLDGANLAGAHLTDALLRGANLRPALPGDLPCPGNLPTVRVASGAKACPARLSGAALLRADLRDADLNQAVLTEADLAEANLEGASLQGANLSDASLEGANLQRANLRDADLTGATLHQADLQDAYLGDTLVSEEQLAQALQRRAGLKPGSALRCTHYQPEGLAGPIWDLELAPDRTVWVAAYEGLAQLDQRSGLWRLHNLDEALPDARVRSITAAPDGTLWFALRLDAGAVRYDGTVWSQVTSEEGLLTNEINTISIGPDDSVWFAGPAGASRWEPETESWTHFTAEAELAGDLVRRVLFTPDGKIWFAQHVALTSFLPAPTQEPTSDGAAEPPTVEPTVEVTATEQAMEDVWDTYRGFRFLGNTEATVSADGRLWLAHAVYDPVSGEWQPTIYDDLQVQDLAVDSRGGLWVARRDGAVYIPDPLSSPREDWVHFGTKEGLPADNVTVLVLETDEVLWVGTEAGVARCSVPSLPRVTATPSPTPTPTMTSP